MRVAEGVESILTEQDDRIPTLETCHHMPDSLANAVEVHGLQPYERHSRLAVAVAAKPHALPREPVAHFICVDERAVVRKGDDSVIEARQVGLGALPVACARSGVAHVPDGRLAFERRDVTLRDDLVNETEALSHQDAAPVGCGNARGFLPPVLQGLEAKVHETCRILPRRPDAKDPALLAQMIAAFSHAPSQSLHECRIHAAVSLLRDDCVFASGQRRARND